MAKRGKRKRRKSLSLWWLLVVPVIALAVFFATRRNAVKTHLPRRSERPIHPWREAEPPRPEQLTAYFEAAIQRAGGDGVWIETQGASPAPPLTIVVTEGAYGAVRGALFRAAQERSLRVDEARVPHEPGAVSFTLFTAQRPVLTLALRQVSRIDRAAIIVDDLGQSLKAAHSLLDLRAPLTFSVMPGLRYSRETAEEAHGHGIEVMLHLPMQPLLDSAPDVSAREIKVGMSRGEVDSLIASGLASVPYAAGVNNHMGSKATADTPLMREVMAELAERHLFYIDSRTIADSVALSAARDAGIPAFYRSVFLDDTASVAYTRNQLERLCKVAEQQGVAVAIGHPYPTTIAALGRFLPELARSGVQLVRVSELLRQPEVARLGPATAQRKRQAGAHGTGRLRTTTGDHARASRYGFLTPAPAM